MKDAIDAIKLKKENENRRILQDLKHQYTELSGDDVDILQSSENETIQNAINELKITKQNIKKNKKIKNLIHNNDQWIRPC